MQRKKSHIPQYEKFGLELKKLFFNFSMITCFFLYKYLT